MLLWRFTNLRYAAHCFHDVNQHVTGQGMLLSLWLQKPVLLQRLEGVPRQSSCWLKLSEAAMLGILGQKDLQRLWFESTAAQSWGLH